MNNRLPQYKTDYIISWDCSDTDLPCVSVSRVGKGESGMICEALGVSFEKYGTISLQQVCEEFEARKRAENEKARNTPEMLKKVFNVKKAGEEDATENHQDLYKRTVERLVRGGAKNYASQIIALAEEIEHYREKIRGMEAKQ